MTWFSTNRFRFELPGDAWRERTIHIFHPPGDPKTGFAITRLTPEKGADNSIEASLAALPKKVHDERTILRKERRYFGAVDVEDVSFYARRGPDAAYYRIVCIPYYGEELSFQWMGPMATREQVDARAEQTLDTLKFWGRR